MPEINGYNGEFKGEKVHYGCAQFDMDEFLDFKLSLGNRDIKSVTLDSGVEITMEQIEQIVKAYQNK